MAGVEVRSRGGAPAATAPGATAHSDLTGLTSGDDHTQYQKESERAAASGYPSLDGATKVPIAQVPTGTTGATVALGNAPAAAQSAAEATAAAGLAGHITGDPHTQYLKESDAAAIAMTGSASDLTTGTLAIARIQDGAVTLVKQAGMASARLRGRATAGAGVPEDLTAAQAKAILAIVAGDVSGLTTLANDALWAAKGDQAVATGNDAAAVVAKGTDFIDQWVPDAAAPAGVKWGFQRNPLRPAAALFETYPRQAALVGNVAALASTTLRMQAIALPAGLTITSISFVSGTTALSAGVHQIFGLYDSSLNLLRGTSDDTSAAWAADSVKTLPLTSSYLTTVSGLFYVGILVQATTMPSLISVISTKNLQQFAPILTGGSSSGTSLPDPAGAITASVNYPYAYVS